MSLKDRDRTQVVERVERTEERRPYVAPVTAAPQTNVNAVTTASPVWTLTRVVTIIFTVLEVLLLFRFLLKLLGANASQPLVAGLYALTDPLVRPFEGIFPVPSNVPLDLAALLAIVFFFLVATLIVALVRAIAGRTA
ncbi:MAG TPA: YggT family protein [Candidatus Limnocylindria bacterium]|nr:YggT family protein [Candidatus Limnocylindria bacterium]